MEGVNRLFEFIRDAFVGMLDEQHVPSGPWTLAVRPHLSPHPLVSEIEIATPCSECLREAQ